MRENRHVGKERLEKKDGTVSLIPLFVILVMGFMGEKLSYRRDR